MAGGGRSRPTWVLALPAIVVACCAAAASGQMHPSSEARALGAPRVDQAPAGPAAGEASRGIGAGRTIWALSTVLGLAVVGAAGARMLGRRGGLRGALGAAGRAPAGVMEVLGRYPVGRGCTLVLLKIDRRILVLCQASTGRLGAGAAFSTLTEIADPDEVASILVKTRDADGESMSERFRSLLTRFDRSMATAESDGGRQSVRHGAGGDRAEFWDAGDIPVVDLTRAGGSAGLLRRLMGGAR